MATSVTLNGSSFQIPAVGESNWGSAVTSYLVAVASGTLQKTGGAFTLSAEVDFGSAHGVKSLYFKSRGTVAATGVVRLGAGEAVSWRDAAGTGDLSLATATDWLQFNGIDLVATTRAQTLEDKTIVAADNTITTAASGNLSATELNAALEELQDDIDTRQVADSDLTAIAALSTTGLATRTAADTWTTRSIAAGSNKLAVTNGDGVSGNPTLDVTEANLTHDNIGGTLGIAKGGTGQTSETAAFDALSPTTTKGDLIVSDGTNNARLAVGSDGQVLTADSGEGSGLAWTSPLTNPMDSVGDMIVGGTSGAATKLDAGSSGQLLMSNGAAAPSWSHTISGEKTFSDGYCGNVPTVVSGTIAVSNGANTSISSLTQSSVPSWVSAGIAGGGSGDGTGTVTLTFSRAGWYEVKAQLSISNLGAYTGAVTMRTTFGGTATIYDSGSTSDTFSIPTPANDVTALSTRMIKVEDPTKTVTINSIVNMATDSGATFRVYYTVTPL